MFKRLLELRDSLRKMLNFGCAHQAKIHKLHATPIRAIKGGTMW